MKLDRDEGVMTHSKVVITSKDEEFDPVIIQNWKAEGFHVSYLPFTSSREDYVHSLQHLADSFELGEHFAIVGMLALVRIESNRSRHLTLLF